jgi:hypothetical protein
VVALLQASSGLVSLGVLGLAYLAGAVFDRVFDTVLEGAEQWTRLRVGKEEHDKSGAPEPEPFDQGEIEARLRIEEGAATWMGYVRTRIRLARTIGVAAPLVATSAVLSSADGQAPGADDGAGILGVFRIPTDAAECLWALLPSLVLVLALASAVHPIVKLPKGRNWNYDTHRARSKAEVSLAAWQLRAFLPVMLTYGVAFGVGLSGATDLVRAAAVLALGAFVGGLALWSWQRILLSYMRFVANCGPVIRQKQGAR